MSADTAAEIFDFLMKTGCDTVHIGGGEPLLRPEKLFPILKAAKQCGINIEYIETNASWFKEEEKAAGLLRELMEYGINTLLISIDPFHNEYIPFYKTKGLMKACKKEGMEVLPWRMEEYEAAFGKHYELQLIQRYYLIFRGRALQTFKGYLEVYPIEEILQKAGPCTELSGVHHFHIDLYGNFIPQSCEGLSIHYRDLFKGALSEKYPILHLLYSKGIKCLYDLAVEKYRFIGKESYTGKCELCYDIRRYLAMDLEMDLPDLQPAGYYTFI